MKVKAAFVSNVLRDRALTDPPCRQRAVSLYFVPTQCPFVSDQSSGLEGRAEDAKRVGKGAEGSPDRPGKAQPALANTLS